MKLFLLNIGEILIDEIDVPIALSCTWSLNGWGYIQGKSNKYRDKYLHKIIAERMGLNVSKLTDHKDLNKFNNQRFNLREATKSQNLRNRNAQSNNKSGFKGVSWCKVKRKWRATIYAGGKHINLGYFDDPEEAHEVYCKAAIKYFGEFARW